MKEVIIQASGYYAERKTDTAAPAWYLFSARNMRAFHLLYLPAPAVANMCKLLLQPTFKTYFSLALWFSAKNTRSWKCVDGKQRNYNWRSTSMRSEITQKMRVHVFVVNFAATPSVYRPFVQKGEAPAGAAYTFHTLCILYTLCPHSMPITNTLTFY